MSRKVLSIVLSLSLLFTCLFTGFTVVSAEEAVATENLLKNGNFESYEGTTPTNWNIKPTENATVEIVEDVEIAEGLTANAIKVNTSANNPNKRTDIYYTSTVAIEKNAKYTTTFWVKTTNINGFRAYMYEPDYIDLKGNPTHNEIAQEGQNIYTYRYLGKDANGNPITRVTRPEIVHSWKVAESGAVIAGSTESMFISRANDPETNKLVEQPLTPDYPKTERQGEWLKVIHTFETGNVDSHKADIRYQFAIPEAVDGEAWVANVEMTADKYYVGNVNDDTLGTVSPAKTPIANGQELTLTAAPYGENLFDGWYVGDELVSEEPELTFTYNGNATPNYVARFTESGFGTAETFEEGWANGTVVAQATATIGPNDTTFVEFANTEKEGSGYFVDSASGGTWRKASISQDFALSGKNSLKFAGQWGCVGRKFTGLEKNTEYTVSVYAYGVNQSDADKQRASVRHLYVTAYGSFKDNTKMLRDEWDMSKTGLVNNGASIVNGWSRFETTFNTGDNTEIIFWVDSSGDNATLYLDNFAIARKAFEYTPKVNDNTLGCVSTVLTRPDAKTTVVATPLGEAIFDGWYNGETLLSKDAKYTFIYSDEAANYEARFIGSGFGVDGAFENYENGKLLAQLQHTGGNVGTANSDWTPDLWKQSTFDGNGEYFMESNNSGNYRKATVSNAYAYAGKQSLKFAGMYGYLGRKLTGLTANTDYIVSFYALVTGDANAKVGQFRVTPTDVAPTLPTGNSIAIENCIAGTHEQYGTYNEWEKVTFKFNSGENTEVILWMNHHSTGAIYIDNFAITRTATVTVENSAYGTTTGGGNFAYNEAVTITATPYEGNTFDGWYVGDELVSTDANYTFNAGNVVLTPKFSGTSYEHFVANGQDGTFENGTIDGIFFDHKTDGTSWCNTAVVDTVAYQGTNSLRLNSRFRFTNIPLTGLDKNTNYTLTYMFKLNEFETAAPDGTMKKADARAYVTTSDNTYYDSENPFEPFASTGTMYSTGDWQKVELSFNTGNNTDFNLLINYSDEDAGKGFMYLDNLSLIRKDTVEPEALPGDVDNDQEVDLDDVNALANYLAGWDVEVNEDVLDVNGDGVLNLKDLVLLAQYVAQWDVTIA